MLRLHYLAMESMMKKFFALILVSILSFNLNAATDSNYSSRHLVKIKEAIAKKCALKGKFVQVSSVVEEVEVDQGVTDYNYKTVFKHRDWIDQGIFDDYSVEVISHYAAMYDHVARDYGFYHVSSVECTMLN